MKTFEEWWDTKWQDSYEPCDKALAEAAWVAALERAKHLCSRYEKAANVALLIDCDLRGMK